MNLAYVVIAFKNFGQVRRMIDRLDDAQSRFAVIADSRSSGAEFNAFSSELAGNSHVHVLPRRAIRWGTLSLAQAGPGGIRWFLKSGFEFDYIFSISGQDYPLMSPDQIRQTLAAGDGKSFMLCEELPIKRWDAGQMGRLYSWNLILGRRVYQFPKWSPARRTWVRSLYSVLNRIIPKRSPLPMEMWPFGGSSHWTLSREAAEYVDRFVAEHAEYERRLRHCLHPDEIYVQTILANSPLKDRVIKSDLRFVHWPSEGAQSPVVLTTKDLPRIIASQAVFARKFDVSADENVLDLIDAHVDAQATVAHNV